MAVGLGFKLMISFNFLQLEQISEDKAGVLAGSLVTCSEVLTRDVIFSQIKKTE